MGVLEQLKEKNPGLKLYSITDPAFVKYGNLWGNADSVPQAKEVMAYLAENARVEKGKGGYERSVAGLEAFTEFNKFVSVNIFGDMPIEHGWCYGWGNTLNGLEYHKSSEVSVSPTDIVILLGFENDIHCSLDGKCNYSYDLNLVEAFYVPAGTVYELKPNVLHLAPNQVYADEQYNVTVVLPAGTNAPLTDEIKAYKKSNAEPGNLTHVNKWMFLHKDLGTPFPDVLKGENITVNML